MKTNDEEYDDDDLGVFVLDKHCEEMERMIKGVGYFLIVIAIVVPIIVVCVLLL
jgi:hypothetical protein